MSGTDNVSSLPIRTNATGDVIAQLADGTTTTQLLGIDASGRLTIKLDDGAGNLVTSQTNGTQRALDVGINVAGVQIDPRQIRALTSADVVTVDQGTTPWVTSDLADGSVTGGTAGTKSNLAGVIYTSTTGLGTPLTTGQQASLQSDANGRLLVGSIAAALPAGTNTIGKVAQDNTTQWITSDLADGSVAAGTAATKSMLGGLVYNSSAPSLTTGQQVALQGDAAGNLLVNLKTSIPAGSALIGGTNVYVGGTIASQTNPLPVFVTQAIAGTPVNYYNATASIAAAGTDSTSSYTITASKTLSIKSVWFSSSVRTRGDFQISTNGSTWTTIATGFNSASDPNVPIDLDFPQLTDTGTGSAVRIVFTNEDIKPGSAYATILGVEN